MCSFRTFRALKNEEKCSRPASEGMIETRPGGDLKESLISPTCSRLAGSLKAASITSFVGTIFHLGITSSTCVRAAITSGCGFTFSDIWIRIQARFQVKTSVQKGKKRREFRWRQLRRRPCTWARRERRHPRRWGRSCAAGASRRRPWTRRRGTGSCSCTLQGLHEFLHGRQVHHPDWVLLMFCS